MPGIQCPGKGNVEHLLIFLFSIHSLENVLQECQRIQKFNRKSA